MAQEGTGKEQSLPEVPLRWSDFVWSLERLRHKPYGKKMRERDWFRINPLEMVILGCQTLTTGAPASRDHGTLVLVMEPLRREMRARPRYWQRLLTVLAKTSQGDAPPLILQAHSLYLLQFHCFLQRCCSSFIAIWKCLKDFSEIQPFIYGWAIADLKVGELLQQLLSERGKSLGVELSSEAQQLVNEIQQLQADANEHVERLLASSSEAESPGRAERSSRSLSEVLGLVLRECVRGREGSVPTAVALQLHLIATEFQDSKNVPQQLDIDSLQQLLSLLRQSSGDFEVAVGHLLSILQLVSVRSNELQLPRESTEEDKEDSGRFEDGEVEKSDPGSPELQDTAPESQQNGDTVPGAPDQPSSPGGLFSALSAAVQKWQEMAGQRRQVSPPSDVPCKLLSLAGVILPAKPLSESLPEATDFFQWPAAVLMAYSTEGYLSDSPHEFLVELLEFVASLAEQGTPPLRVLQTNLPNLFGPVFGIRSHAVSCKLLEYGYLAVCSQHQRSLLTEGLRFLMEVFRLFPPIDEVRAHAQARVSHLEALEISHSIMEDLLASLLPGENDPETTPLGEPASLEKQEATSPPDTTEYVEPPPEDASSASHKGEGSQLEAVSDVEREIDKQARLAVLLRLFKLACAMIRNGDNTSFLYASILPKLFQQSPPEVPEKFNEAKLKRFFGEDPPPPASGISWKEDKKKLALQLLDLTILSVENDIATPFQLCGIVVPKLVKNLDKMRFSDEEKLTLTIDVLKMTQETLENGHNIDELISHGIDLLSNLLPESASGDELRQFIGQMARQFVTSSHSSLLFLVKNSCHFMRSNFPDESEGVQQLFRTLIYRGKRDEIRGVFRVCKDPLKQEQFAPLRQYLYSFASGSLSHRQLVALCELLITAMDLGRPQRVVRETQTMVEAEGEDENELVERRDKEGVVVGKLTAPCLHQLEEALRENRFKKDIWESISAQLSQIALFRTLFQEQIVSLSDLSAEELLETFRSKFPQEILSSEDTMQLLALCATRIEHMQSPRFDSLKTLLSRVLRHFLTLETPPASPTPIPAEIPPTSIAMETPIAPSTLLERRMKGLGHFLASLPRNMEDREKLVQCGYSSRLWEEKFSMTVKTDGSHSLEENMRQTLLACYSEFSDILKQMAVTHVSVDGEMVKVSTLFSEELSLTDLKGRRAIAVRVIDERMGRAKEGHFYERKVTLLAKEDEVEADFDKQAKAPVKPKTFTVALNTSFFDCARCCGPQIIGCYVPTGEHCERPLEVGMRDDSAIVSIYDESGMEIENLETLFTEEGAYFFKAYSNGHPYDTSQVWISLFTNLLKEPSLVPSIIIPKGYPNQRTWETLRRCVSTELTGSILTCRHNFSPEWRTYYDYRPERVRLGVDVVLHPGFTLSGEQSKPLLHRQKSRLTKDLAGLIFEEVMQDLLEDEWLKQFKFLGKVVSQYISVCIQEGERRSEIVAKGFDYERWKKAYSRTKEPPPLPSSLAPLAPPPAEDPAAPPTKEQLVQHLVGFVNTGIVRWCGTADLEQLCISSHKQLLEMKNFLEKTTDFPEHGILKTRLKQLRNLLARCVFVVPVLSFPEPLQEEAMHWIFQNEDRVWRYRGGRDGHETLQQFMSFLGKGPGEKGEREGGRGRKPKETYAGVLVFCLPRALETGRDMDIASVFQVRHLVGYAVGEVPNPVAMGDDSEVVEQRGVAARWRPLDPDCYEIVTAWVHPSYRGLNLSVQMYLEIIKQAPARLVMCDMLQGSVERIIRSNGLLRFLSRIGMSRLVFQKRQISYTVITQTGVTEQFEQVVFSVRPLRVALRVYRVASWLRMHPISTAVLTVAMVTISFKAYLYWKA